MPCRDYYDDHPEQYFRDVTEPTLRKRIAFAESALCAVLDVFDAQPYDEMWNEINFEAAGITSMELSDWHDEHRARDQQVRAAKIQAARAKLTPEEITLLGLDK